MIQTALLIALFSFLFAAFRELSEHAKEGAFKNLHDWWNTPQSFWHKYHWGPKYLPFIPERLSIWIFKTVLVWTTDAEHFFQFLSLLCFLATVFILGNWQLALVAYLAQAFAGFLKTFTPIK